MHQLQLVSPSLSFFKFFQFYYYYYYYYYYYFTYELFIPALPNGLSLEYNPHQISTCIQDSSQYSGRSQQCCNFDGFDLSDFQYFQIPLQAFEDDSSCAIYNCSHIPHLLSSLARSQYMPLFSFTMDFTPSSAGTQSLLDGKFSGVFVCFILFCFLIIIGSLAYLRWFVFISKSQWTLRISSTWMGSGLCIYHFVR